MKFEIDRCQGCSTGESFNFYPSVSIWDCLITITTIQGVLQLHVNTAAITENAM